MSRLTDFTDAVNAAVAAATSAVSGKGFTDAYVQIAFRKLLVVQAELGEGDAPAAEPLVVSEPAPE